VYVKRHMVRKGDRQYVYLRLARPTATNMAKSATASCHPGARGRAQGVGQLDLLAASFARLDPPAAGTTREVGPLLLVAHYLGRLGLVGLVDEAAPMRGRASLTHGEVVASLVGEPALRAGTSI